jgi:hypothetical protein
MSNENDVIVTNCILSWHEKVSEPRESWLIKTAVDPRGRGEGILPYNRYRQERYQCRRNR